MLTSLNAAGNLVAIEDGGWAFQRLVGRQVHVQVEQMLLLYNTLHACTRVELPQLQQKCRNSTGTGLICM